MNEILCWLDRLLTDDPSTLSSDFFSLISCVCVCNSRPEYRMQAVRITQTALQELDPSPLANTLFQKQIDKESVEDSTTLTSRRLAVHRSKRKCWGGSAQIAWLPPVSSQLDPPWALRATIEIHSAWAIVLLCYNIYLVTLMKRVV